MNILSSSSSRYHSTLIPILVFFAALIVMLNCQSGTHTAYSILLHELSAIKHKAPSPNHNTSGSRLASTAAAGSTTGIPSQPPCISYNSTTRTIRVSCIFARISDINNIIHNNTILSEESSDGIWLLNSNLVISKGATLYINSTDTKWLKIVSNGMSSLPENHIDVFGGLKVDSVKITSWNPSINSYSTITNNNTSTRPYIKIEANASGTTDITNSEIAYLGSKYNPKRGSGTSGLEYFNGGDGSVLRGNNIHNNWYGVYIRGVGRMIIENNDSHNNYNYGFDPHTGSHDIIIRHNEVHDNGGQGIICSLNCYNITFENNKVYHNADSGIMFSKNTSNSVARNNLVYDEKHAGIFSSSGSHDNKIYNNTVLNSENGIYLKNYSSNNIVHDNTIIHPAAYGLYLNSNASGNTFYSNTIANAGHYAIYVQGSDPVNNTFKNNKLIINSSSSSSLPSSASLLSNVIKIDDNNTNTQLINNTIISRKK
jgi:mannuronan 5-epimerase